MATSTHRRPASRIVTLLAAAVVIVGGMLGGWAAPAEATSYRFWAYWLGGDDGWSFSSQGASRIPADGTVDGWRFAVSEASSSTSPPRHTPSFARICGSTEPVDGSKRVGVVVDFGTTADAPAGESPPATVTACVVAEPGANGYDVLTEVVQIRTDAGLICGMDGYPATECGAAVADPEPSPSSGPSGTGSGDGGGGPDTSGDGDGSPGGGQGGQRAGDPEPGTANGDPDSQGKSGGKKNADGRKADEPSNPTTSESPVDVSPAAAAADSPTGPAAGSPAGLVAGLGVVAALLAAAFVLRRRRT